MADSIRRQRDLAIQRWGQLVTERSSWLEHWQELAHYTLPRSGRFFETNATSEPNRGDKKHQHIYDNTAVRSSGVLTAGLMAGVTSPARPWFRLQTPDPQLNERQPVKQWLHEVERRMRQVFNQSNTYRAFRQIYEELGVFGTAADVVLPDFENVLHHYPMTVGTYALDTNAKNDVNTLYRKFKMNVGQIVGRFGYKNCSTAVRTAYDRGNLTPWHDVLHVIEPRRERDPLKIDNRNMPYSSVYYEMAARDDEVLRVSGYREFPALTPRWAVRGEDVYGQSPGMVALGDTKQLQHQQFRKSQAIDYMTKPPLQAPTSAQQGGLNLTPGKVNFVDVAQTGVRSLWEVNMDLSAMLGDIEDVRFRIKQAYYEDLFLMITSRVGGNSRDVTAREIAERHEEKLLMLGPVLESLHDEMLKPYIEMAFSYMLEHGLIPPPPREVEGTELSVQFISLLAQAQRLVGLGAVDRLIGTVLNVSQIKPSVADKLDGDAIVNEYADMLGTDPDLIVADDKVALIRQQRQQRQQAAAAAEAAPQAAKAAKDLSDADENTQAAAVQALNQLGGA